MEKEKKSMKIEDIRELCKEAHENAVRHGFWDEEHDIRHYELLRGKASAFRRGMKAPAFAFICE